MENVPSTKLKPIDCEYDAANSTKVPMGLPDAVKISGQAALMADASKAFLHRAEAPRLGFVASPSVARRKFSADWAVSLTQAGPFFSNAS
jgi:hypothetical protein